jgi:hypothetical protein
MRIFFFSFFKITKFTKTLSFEFKKLNLVKWDLFHFFSLSLTRLDLCYDQRKKKSSNGRFSRVYEKGQDIRFELEIKKLTIKKFEDYLFNLQLNLFEFNLTRFYY